MTGFTGERLVRIVHRGVFNCYVVCEDDGLTLIDTGPTGALPAIRAKLAQLGAPLRRIVLTHAHSDHLGGVQQLAAEFSGRLEIIVARREAPLLAGDFTVLPGEPGSAPGPRGYGTLQSEPTRLVDDGDLIGSLKVIATPGHTPGHLSLLDTADQTLIAGDAVTSIGRVAVSGDLVWRWPFPAMSTWSKPLAVQSAKRLLAEHPDRLATGHGPIVNEASRHLRAAIEHAS